VVEGSEALRSACACRSDSPFPVRIPTDFTLFTRLIPAANSGEQSVIDRLPGQLSNCGHPYNDRGRTGLAGLE